MEKDGVSRVFLLDNASFSARRLSKVWPGEREPVDFFEMYKVLERADIIYTTETSSMWNQPKSSLTPSKDGTDSDKQWMETPKARAERLCSTAEFALGQTGVTIVLDRYYSGGSDFF